MRLRGVRIRAAVAAISVLALLGLESAPAVANGDPASDLLYQDNVYYPYKPAVSAPFVRDLNLLTETAARTGYPIKVAIIASPDDLGAAQDLWQKPQDYANLLGSEIVSYYPGPLLVAMPGGFGVAGANLPPNVNQALRRVSIDSSADSDSLAGSAVDGVVAMSAAAGHPLPPVSSAGKRSSHAFPTGLLVGGLIVVFVAGLGTALFFRRRRWRAQQTQEAANRSG